MESGRVFHWFFKESSTDLERKLREYVKDQEPVDRGPYQETCDKAVTQDLPAIMNLVRFYLG